MSGKKNYACKVEVSLTSELTILWHVQRVIFIHQIVNLAGFIFLNIKKSKNIFHFPLKVKDPPENSVKFGILN